VGHARAALLLSALLLPGCGAVYTTPLVRQDETARVAFVEVELTQATVAQANLLRYDPRQLPGAFYGGSRLSATPVAPPPPQGRAVPYRLGPGDIIELKGKSLQSTSVEAEFRLSDSMFQLRDDGTIDMSGIGVLRLGELTLAEANAALDAILTRERIDPTYRIEVAEYNARAVAVDGDVGAPGLVAITMAPLTMDRALALRGGLRVEDRRTASVTLFRDGQSYGVRGDNVEVMSTVVLRDGDSLVVDEGRTRSEERALFAGRAQANAEPRDHVYIAGEVATPRTIEMPLARQLLLSEVLLGGGGVPPITGDLSQVYIIRTYGHGNSATVYHLDAVNVVNLALATRMELRPQDIVFVSQQRLTRWSRFLSQLEPGAIAAAVNAVR